jgi:hypothetical protein
MLGCLLGYVWSTVQSHWDKYKLGRWGKLGTRLCQIYNCGYLFSAKCSFSDLDFPGFQISDSAIIYLAQAGSQFPPSAKFIFVPMWLHGAPNVTQETSQHDPKTIPNLHQIEPKLSQRHLTITPNWSHNDPKVTQNSLNWRWGHPKVTPMSIKRDPKGITMSPNMPQCIANMTTKWHQHHHKEQRKAIKSKTNTIRGIQRQDKQI